MENQLFIWAYFVGSWVIPLCFIGGSYAKIIRTVRQTKFSTDTELHHKGNHHHYSSNSPQSTQKRFLRRCPSLRQSKHDGKKQKKSQQKIPIFTYVEFEMSSMNSTVSSKSKSVTNLPFSETRFGADVTSIDPSAQPEADQSTCTTQCIEIESFESGRQDQLCYTPSSSENHWSPSASNNRWKRSTWRSRSHCGRLVSSKNSKLLQTQPREVCR